MKSSIHPPDSSCEREREQRPCAPLQAETWAPDTAGHAAGAGQIFRARFVGLRVARGYVETKRRVGLGDALPRDDHYGRALNLRGQRQRGVEREFPVRERNEQGAKELTPQQQAAVASSLTTALNAVASNPAVREAVSKALGPQISGIVGALL